MTDSNITYITMDSFPKSPFFSDRKISLSITKPGTYILNENIIAGSIYAGDDDTVLNFGRQVGPPPFHFGVWSIISIECDDVILDLNGHSLKQSDLHYTHQRFFSCIELNKSPFIKSQGPSDFGDAKNENSDYPKNIYICNGKLGKSSHHSIHGNGNKNVLIENLIIKDFEVAAIAINGGENIILRYIETF